MVMTTVFIDAAAIPSGSEASAGVAVEESARALAYLVDAGFGIVLVGSLDDVPLAVRSAFTEVTDEATGDPARTSWFLTGDPARCGRPIPHVRTILIGVATEGPARPVHRCDRVVRDLRTAVLEVLANDAMPPRDQRRH
jgi:hypothetical protein